MEVTFDDLLVIIGQLTVEIKSLRAQVAQLEARMRENSANSNGAVPDISEIVDGEIEIEEIKSSE